MDISTSTLPPSNNTISCNTDFVEVKTFAALLREADETEGLEAQVKEKEEELSRLWKFSNLLRNRYEQLLKDNDVLTRDVRQRTTRLKELQKKTSKWPEQMNEPLSVSMQYFNLLLKQILNASSLLTAAGFSGSPKPSPRWEIVNIIYDSNTSLTEIRTPLAPRI